MPIALDRFPHLTTTFTFLPTPKPTYKILFRRFLEADDCATTVNDPPQPEALVVTLDDYVFHYEILAEGEVKAEWTGKGHFRADPGMANEFEVESDIKLPLTPEAARLIGEMVTVYARPSFDHIMDWLQLRTTITESKSLRTAKIYSTTQAIADVGWDAIFFEDHPIAHPIVGAARQLYRDGGDLFLSPSVEFWSAAKDIDAVCSIILVFQWEGHNDLIYPTQHQLLLELQSGTIFNYRASPP
jgi:hypothetical protein